LRTKLNLAYLCTSLGWGGLEMNHLRNALWMQARGHTVTLICTQNSPLHRASVEAKLSIIPIRKPARHYAFFSAFYLLQKLKKLGVQNVFIRNTSDLSLAASIAFFSRKQINVHYFMEMMFKGKKRQVFRTIRYAFLSSWICSLEYMKNDVLSATNVHPKKVLVIPSALDFSKISSLSKVEARKQFQLPENKVIYGMIGRIDRKKRLELAILALEQLKNSNYHLIFVGEETPDAQDSYQTELQNLIQEKKLEGHVHFCGFHAETSSFYRAIDALIMASDFETFGMSTIEALAHQTPVIATNSGGSKELLTKFPFGILVEPGNPSSFAYAMENLAQIVPENFDKTAFQSYFDHERICEMIESRILSCESVR
jgi:glycosyltransferase involved in cell wall biosynthesis